MQTLLHRATARYGMCELLAWCHGGMVLHSAQAASLELEPTHTPWSMLLGLPPVGGNADAFMASFKTKDSKMCNFNVSMIYDIIET